MDIDALRSFIAFVDTGSFTRAAKQTFRTQSAISMQMKKLEEESGQALFIKEGRNLVLTEHGQILVSYARRILSLHDEVIGNFSRSNGHPPLVIGCPDDYAESILPQLITLILEKLPQQNIKICCHCSSQLRLKLDTGEIHIAILTGAPDIEEGYLLKHDRGVWVHGGYPHLINADPLALILYEADCKFHSAAIDGLEKQGINYRLLCSASSATAIKSLLRQGLGISAVATSTVSQGLSIESSAQLPPLPFINIVLATAPIPHPLFGSAIAAEVSQTFRAKHACDN
ncbi:MULTISPECIES: LysR family transcriptional regulator [unclassified Neptuniibacter]|uniref:LysR family transcriptional regulator n=1 Tax=unclassified Neptuniibacter TaxID=2630693 RepID=UPI0026E35E3E|nr:MULTISPECIES: LysR family transcriptional regulator [unclassified Neptuniibacter]MDO6513196.1 LysR family transcriptional regulator [Neptuniibacter sp. 2_MG-2023]MDO6592392.1 LysR family transcriptional regulator [Neptuniibacter sp. 1_MG-2023]